MNSNLCVCVSVLQCGYTSQRQSDYCKIQGHLIQKHTANKRFFKCRHCGDRLAIFDLVPTKPCSVSVSICVFVTRIWILLQKCESTEFDRCAMRDERKTAPLPGESLQLTGDEIPLL